MSANKIKKPILLIHGEQDNNSGTLTMQVKSCALFRETYYTPFIYIIQFYCMMLYCFSLSMDVQLSSLFSKWMNVT
jgi:hypothetical protein